ncbi:MAG TPA: hypothetical protein VJ302_36370 [Blastocatellia bacterium]|nr:hypothetical protein [Blastocatellia bacterium]
MRKLIWAAALMAVIPIFASAQTSDVGRTQAYVFIAPGVATGGGASAQLQFGGGVDALVYKGVGLGAEIGYNGRLQSLRNGFGIFSVNGSYHFEKDPQAGKFDPFVTGGYSRFFSGSANALNFGVGTNYWFTKKTGMRLEFRDNVPFRGGGNFIAFRLGLTFR